MFDNIFPSRQIEAEVSSQEDSMARIVALESGCADKKKLIELAAKVGEEALANAQRLCSTLLI
jgi:hypothetical protein